jgi:hypothetical protein
VRSARVASCNLVYCSSAQRSQPIVAVRSPNALFREKTVDAADFVAVVGANVGVGGVMIVAVGAKVDAAYFILVVGADAGVGGVMIVGIAVDGVGADGNNGADGIVASDGVGGEGDGTEEVGTA